MKIRHSGGAGEKIEIQMAPMIDVVFQLLIFFMLTLKIVEPEGDFTVNMPIGAPQKAQDEEIDLVKLILTLKANPDGSLREMALGGTKFPVPPADDEAARERAEEAAFELLNQHIGQVVESQSAVRGSRDNLEVELKAEYNLDWNYTIQAVSACSGKLVKGSEGQSAVKPYIKNIKFAPPQRPAEGAGG